MPTKLNIEEYGGGETGSYNDSVIKKELALKSIGLGCYGKSTMNVKQWNAMMV